MTARSPGAEPIYLWAAFGGPGVVPDRLEIKVCERCGAVVDMERADAHERWHRQHGEA